MVNTDQYSDGDDAAFAFIVVEPLREKQNNHSYVLADP